MKIPQTTFFNLLALGAPLLAMAQAPLATSPTDKAPVAAAVAGARELTAFDGALFFTAKQRLEMERDRRQKLAGVPATIAEDGRSVINGVATRSDGKLTVWVDGQPRWENANARHLAKLSSADVGSSAGFMRPAGTEGSAQLAMPAEGKKSVKRRNKSSAK